MGSANLPLPAPEVPAKLLFKPQPVQTKRVTERGVYNEFAPLRRGKQISLIVEKLDSRDGHRTDSQCDPDDHLATPFGKRRYELAVTCQGTGK